MDLGNLSRNAQNANHYRDVLRKRGYTYRGDKLWEATEDAIVRSTAHLTVAEAQKRLPHRSCRAVERRRKNIAVSRRKLKPWTTLEDRTLRNNINLLIIRQLLSFYQEGAFMLYKAEPGISAFERAAYVAQSPRGFRSTTNCVIAPSKMASVSKRWTANFVLVNTSKTIISER
jgi:hypothetical protein